MKFITVFIACAMVVVFVRYGSSQPKPAGTVPSAAEKVPDSTSSGASGEAAGEAVQPPAPANEPAKEAMIDSSNAPAKPSKGAADTAKSRDKAPKTATAKAPAAASEPKTPADFKKIGDQLAKKGQTDKAMAAYKQCVEKIEGDTALYSNVIKMLGDYSLAKRQYGEALRYFSMVKGKYITQTFFQIAFARCLQLTGKNNEAIELLEPLAVASTLKPEPKREMMKILGDACVKINLADKAVAWYGKYLKLGGAKTPDVVYMIAFSQEASAPAKAKLRYEENIKSFPNDFRNYLHAGMLLAGNKATAQRSAALLKKASSLAANSSSAWLEIGRVYGKLGKTDDELDAYHSCLKLDTDNIEAKSRIGSILLARGKTADAISLLEGAHKQAPDSIGPMNALATAYLKTKRPKDAIELLVKAKAAKPKDVKVCKQLFEAYRVTGQDQKALEEIKAVLELKRDNEALLAYGKLLLKTGKLDEAASAMEDIRSTAPDNIEALMMLAKIFRAQKKLNEAMDIYKEVSSIDGKAAAPLCERAEIYLEQNKIKWAEQFYQRALEADPKMALAQLGLAKIALQYGNRQGYLDQLDKAVSMDPDNPVIRQEVENSKNPNYGKAKPAPKAGKEEQKTEKDE